MNVFLPAAVMDQFHEGIAVLDAEHRIQYLNARFESIFSIDRRKTIGLKLEHFLSFSENWNWSEVYKFSTFMKRKTKYSTPIADISISVLIVPIPSLDGRKSFLFAFSPEFESEKANHHPNSPKAFDEKNFTEEIFFIASLPEMANTSNSSEEFLERSHLKLIRAFRYQAVATWVYTQTKELTLGGAQGESRNNHEFADEWLKKFKRHIDEVLQSDMIKSFTVDHTHYVVIPHNKRGSMFAVTIVAMDESKSATDGETKAIQIFGHQLAVSYENTKLQEGSTMDALTKLFNAKFFHNRIASELLIAETTQSPLGLLVIDVDHFKKFNDTYGHTTGDFVLAEVAKVIKNSCRASDVVCRYGGEEFTVILIDTDSQGAQIAAEKIRSGIEVYKLMDGKNELRVTASIGVATFPDVAMTKEELIERADSALYLSKRNGRNMVTLFQKKS